jgi:NADPH:quinone reductase-like Zn-dependent oxidoreductase
VQAFYLRLKLPQYPDTASGAPWILIWSGATSVGQYAIQLAKLSGLRVATVASPSRWDLLRGLGADVLVDYKVIAAKILNSNHVVLTKLKDPEVSEKLKKETNNGIVYGLDW